MKAGGLILFVKAPRLGAVKTRLGSKIGHLAAWRFYNLMLLRLWMRLGNDSRWQTYLSVSPDRNHARWPVRLIRWGQGRGNLGVRMTRAMRRHQGPVVLVGGDIPEIDKHHIAQALRALRKANVVFGPAKDGGFWLVGLRQTKLADRLFKNIRWSSPNTLRDCLANLPNTSRVAMLDMLSDVDTLEDYTTYSKSSRRRGRSSAKLQGRNRMSN